jgi:hypothetical protein
MSIPANIDEYQLSLFSSADEMAKKHLPQEMVTRLLRLRSLYTFWLNFPDKTTREMVQQERVMNPEVKERQAYDDIKLLKLLIGNLEQESKEWHRHVFNTRTERIYKEAMRAQDYRSAEKANADYAKYNKLNIDEPEELDYSEIVPQIIEPTSDPTVIGIKPVKDLRGKIQKMKKKLGADIEDADFIELKDDESGEETGISE